jgi:hypothetical protein
MMVSTAIAPVSDDQLALAAPDRRHGVDGLDAGLQRLADRLPRHDSGGLHLYPTGLRGLDLALAVDGLTQGVHHPTQQRLAYGDLVDAAGAAHQVAFAHVSGLAHERDADVVLFQVEHHPGDVTGKLDQLAGHDLVQAVDTRDPIAHGEHVAGLGHVDVAAVVLDLALEDVGDLAGLDVHRSVPLREVAA